MIHTRVRSVSESSVEPTQGFGFLASRSNSAESSAGHCDLSFFSAALSRDVYKRQFRRSGAGEVETIMVEGV